MDPIWYNDFSILFSGKRFTEFFPHPQMTLEEKLNALVRFSIYFFVVLLILMQSANGVYFILAIMAITYFMYQSSPSEQKRKKLNQLKSGQGNKKIEKKHELGLQPVNPTEARMESKQTKCVKPTRDNPFMNFDIVNDMVKRPNRPPACNYREVKDDVNDKFNYNLYRDVDDVFDKNNSQNRFYTMPVTEIVNDQTLFAKSLYMIPDGTCKENQYNCSGKYPSTDLRYKRGVLIDPRRTPS